MNGVSHLLLPLHNPNVKDSEWLPESKPLLLKIATSQPKCIREQRGYQTKTLLLKVAILLLQIVRKMLSKGTHKDLLTLIGSVIGPFVDDLPSCYHLVSTAFRYDDAPWQHEHDSRDWCVVQHHDHYYGM